MRINLRFKISKCKGFRVYLMSTTTYQYIACGICSAASISEILRDFAEQNWTVPEMPILGFWAILRSAHVWKMPRACWWCTCLTEWRRVWPGGPQYVCQRYKTGLIFLWNCSYKKMYKTFRIRHERQRVFYKYISCLRLKFGSYYGSYEIRVTIKPQLELGFAY